MSYIGWINNDVIVPFLWVAQGELGDGGGQTIFKNKKKWLKHFFSSYLFQDAASINNSVISFPLLHRYYSTFFFFLESFAVRNIWETAAQVEHVIAHVVRNNDQKQL